MSVAERLRRVVEAGDLDGTITVRWLARLLDEEGEGDTEAPGPVLESEPSSWREKLWTAPADTRIGTPELVEAVTKSRDWVYRHTSPKAGPDRLPHRKLDGELVFLVGEVREWLEGHEDVIVAASRRKREDVIVAAPRRRGGHG